MVLSAIFRVENNTFAERLQIVIQDNSTTQIILKENNPERHQGIYPER